MIFEGTKNQFFFGLGLTRAGTDNPNIMNVAVTRAKEEFYIIGDKEMYLSLNSDVINDTCKIIEKHNMNTSL